MPRPDFLCTLRHSDPLPESDILELKTTCKDSLFTPKINTVHRHLWLAGVSRPAHPLHVQISLKRSIFLSHFHSNNNNNDSKSGKHDPLYIRDHVDERYTYGELQHSRISAIYRSSLPHGWPRLYALIPSSSIERKVTLFASFTVALSALQGNAKFQKASEVAAVLSLVVIVMAIGLLPVLWLPLFVAKTVYNSDIWRHFDRRAHGLRYD